MGITMVPFASVIMDQGNNLEQLPHPPTRPWLFGPLLLVLLVGLISNSRVPSVAASTGGFDFKGKTSCPGYDWLAPNYCIIGSWTIGSGASGTVEKGSILVIKGNLTNLGNLTIKGTVEVQNPIRVLVNNGTLINTGTLNNNGTIKNLGTIINKGNIYNQVLLKNRGTLT